MAEVMRKMPRRQGELMAVSGKKYMQRDGLPRIGGPMRDATVMSLDGQAVRLSALARNGRPLVLNFGSCS